MAFFVIEWLYLVGLAQMVRASDCGPEGRRFDPEIPPQMIEKMRPFAGLFLMLGLVGDEEENTDTGGDTEDDGDEDDESERKAATSFVLRDDTDGIGATGGAGSLGRAIIEVFRGDGVRERAFFYLYGLQKRGFAAERIGGLPCWFFFSEKAGGFERVEPIVVGLFLDFRFFLNRGLWRGGGGGRNDGFFDDGFLNDDGLVDGRFTGEIWVRLAGGVRGGF